MNLSITQPTILKGLFLSLGILLLCIACNRSSSKSSEIMHNQYMVTLEEGFDKKYLVKSYGDLIDQIGKTSKTDNTYFISFNENVNQEEIAKLPHVINVNLLPRDVAPPKIIKGKKGSASPINK